MTIAKATGKSVSMTNHCKSDDVKSNSQWIPGNLTTLDIGQ